MKIIFSNHAQIKIFQRKIKKIHVARTISSPDYIHYEQSGRDQFYKKFSRFYLKVVARRLKNSVIVITTYWVAKIPKSNKISI